MSSIFGYSMPAYDIDFKSMLIDGLRSNRNRANIYVKIITKKESDEHINNIMSQYKYLVGNVEIQGEHGFYNYITGN